MISYGLVYQNRPEIEKKGIFAPRYGHLSDIILPSASGYVLATYYRYDIDRENPKLFAGKNIENALRGPYSGVRGRGALWHWWLAGNELNGICS